ncbi:MAG: ferrochelatase [Alphaproteobacteria bacterium]
MNKKIAFILMNYGGPQNLDEVKTYLRNIFKDPAILQVPFLLRQFLSYKITKARLEKSQDIFKKIGNKSPINEETLSQIKAIEDYIEAQNLSLNVKGFMAQRYAPPFAKDVMGDIIAFNPEQIILLPMYPQFSLTTTESSLKDFIRYTPRELKDKIKTIHYFYTDTGWQNYFVEQITHAILNNQDNYEILYSAHSIPQAYVDAGDIYEEQVKDSLNIIHKKVEEELGHPVKYHLAWQSKVGKMKWLSPSVEETILRLKNTNLIIVPLSFVAENSETLVELDMDMKDIALNNGTKSYIRIPTPTNNPQFMAGLAQRIIELI